MRMRMVVRAEVAREPRASSSFSSSSSASSASSSSSSAAAAVCSTTRSWRRRRHLRRRLRAAGVGGVDGPSNNATTRRKMLLKYVSEVQPHLIDQFVQHAPSQVVEAMRETVATMVGTLPTQFFEVTVTTTAENLCQLMYSTMMTGYMFRNAQVRLELSKLELPGPVSQPSQTKLPDSGGARQGLSLDAATYAPGTQKTNVHGDVLRWNLEDEAVEAMDARKYIESLEGEVIRLRQELVGVAATKESATGSGGNELLAYLRSLEPQNLQELTSMANDDVLEAMNSFIKRLIESNGEVEMRAAVSESTAPELSKLLYWLLVVGYSLRSIEVRIDMGLSLSGSMGMADLAGELPSASGADKDATPGDV